VSVKLPGQSGTTQVGNLQTIDFVNPAGLQPIGENLYIETASSGTPIPGTPGLNGLGQVIGGALEGLERQCRLRARQHDRDPARLRDELQGHLDERPDDAVRQQQPRTLAVITETACRVVLLLAVAMSLSACATPRIDEDVLEAPMPITTVYANPDSGAIFAGGTEIRLFEDRTATRVGDILTVRLVEQTRASKDASTSTSKESGATLTNPTVFGRPVTRKGVPVLEGSLEGQRSFDGTGSSSPVEQPVRRNYGHRYRTAAERQPRGRG
jgi:hypothetical protein